MDTKVPCSKNESFIWVASILYIRNIPSVNGEKFPIYPLNMISK